MNSPQNPQAFQKVLFGMKCYVPHGTVVTEREMKLREVSPGHEPEEVFTGPTDSGVAQRKQLRVLRSPEEPGSAKDCRTETNEASRLSRRQPSADFI